MNKKTHVLILPSWYPLHPKDIGGSFFREQAIALQKNGHKVGVISLHMRSIKDIKGITTKPYRLLTENDNGVVTYRYHSVNYTPKFSKLTKYRSIQQGLSTFKQYIATEGMPDIIHVHSMVNAGFLAHAISNLYGIPYLITEHNTAFVRGLITEDQISLLQPIIAKSSFCFGVSQFFSQHLNTMFHSDKWRYLPNIVNSSFFSMPLSKEIKAHHKNIIFITISFLTLKKRVDLIIHAFALFLKKVPTAILKIGGDGEERVNLENLVNQLGIQDNIEFLGMLSRSDVRNHMEQSDAFLLASDFETFGVVLIEALALGKPVIATKCGGPESIVHPSVGYLAEKGSVESFSQKMFDLYENIEKFSPDKLRQFCLDSFSETVIVDKLTNYYCLAINSYNDKT